MSTTGAVFIVDDDDGHAYLIELNLRASGLRNELVRFSDGKQLLEFFESADADSRWPAIILLDINMPGIDGIAVLERLKEDPATQSVPIIMLSTTADPEEVKTCYQLGCALFLTKPVQYAEFTRLINKFGEFLALAKLPTGVALGGRT